MLFKRLFLNKTSKRYFLQKFASKKCIFYKEKTRYEIIQEVNKSKDKKIFYNKMSKILLKLRYLRTLSILALSGETRTFLCVCLNWPWFHRCWPLRFWFWRLPRRWSFRPFWRQRMLGSFRWTSMVRC